MSSKNLFLALVGCCCVSSFAFAQSPFDGTWKLNAAKSNLAGDTMTIEDAGNGALKYTDSDQTYTFKPDGSSITTPMGQDRSFVKGADGSYTSTVKLHGTLLRTNTWKVAADGNTLTIESKGTKPNGDAFDDFTTYTRTAPGEGIVGGWKSTQVKLSSPNSISIKTDGDDVTLTISAIKASCQARWDGKDHGCSGPTLVDGLTVALTKTGPTTFKLVEKKKDKMLSILRYRVAKDGQALYMKGTNGEGKEPFTEVWDKQS